MSTKIRTIAVIVATIIAVTWIMWPRVAAKVNSDDTSSGITPDQFELLHRQETWISALEWCESRGKNAALNPKDRDGTPSYSNFQWKPSTILEFAKKYHLIGVSITIDQVPDLLKDYNLQRETIRHMIADPGVNWYQQFPDCIKLKVGLPPKK